MNWTKIAARGSTVLVAAVAGFASFRHIVDVAVGHGEDRVVAAALPFCIDALMLAAVAAMTEDKRSGLRPRLSARLAFGFGVAASVAANIASADPTIGARVVASVPPLALLLAVEVLSRSGRPRRKEAVGSDVKDDIPHHLDESPAVAVSAGGPRSATATAGRRAGRPSAAEKVARAIRRTPDATPAQLAARLKISERTVQRHLRASGDDKTPPNGQVNGVPVAVPVEVTP